MLEVPLVRSRAQWPPRQGLRRLAPQELLQGFNGRRAKAELLSRLAALACRRHGLQIGTIDAVLIQLCRRHELTLLSADQDFAAAARWVGFRLWRGA